MNHPAPPGSAESQAWSATQVQTQVNTRLLAEDDEQTPTAPAAVGRQVGHAQHELFVSCEAGLALQQQFEHLAPEFIAMHDIATTLSTRLLKGVAAASKQPLQSLVIRRQGYGNTLATIYFVELHTASGRPLRLYSTEAEADAASRKTIARALLAFSRLGAMLVGELPAQQLASTFKPLQDDMLQGPWPNRHLLLLPMSAATPLATLGMELSRSTGIDVRSTPTISKPADAWNFITGTWTRLNEGSTPTAPPAAPPEPAPRAAKPLPMRAMPAVGTGASQATQQDPIDRYVQQIALLNGLVSCCVFEVATGRAVSHAGASPRPEELAEHGTELVGSMLMTSRDFGYGHAIPDASITLGAHHLLIRAIPRHPSLALHAVFDKTANITLARLQVGRMDALFD